eukprot:m.342772 g.342772  ORF g.342772 m.342772 type:complete len:413 (+) comp21817_c0_seq1:117-1355(+)
MRQHGAVLLVLSVAIRAQDFPPPLPEMASHKFLFVVGPHHAGTTLMSVLVSQNSEASGLINTSVPQAEGQHLQNVYPQAYNLGGMTGYAFNPESHITEQSPLCTPNNAVRLFRAWSPFWNLSKRVLVEKTPNHMLMTRFLQRMFSPERTRFLVTIRHPLGATHFKWKLPKMLPEFQETCGERYVKHWLQQMDILKEDLPYLRSVTMVMFEYFVPGGRHQGNYERLMKAVGLPAEMDLSIDKTKTRLSLEEMQRKFLLRQEQQINAEEMDERKKLGRKMRRLKKQQELIQAALDQAVQWNQQNPSSQKDPREIVPDSFPRRKILGLHTNGEGVHEHTRHLTLHDEGWMNWVSSWEERIPNFTTAPQCLELFQKYEKRVNYYGYSLIHPERVNIPAVFAPYIVIPHADEMDHGS